jgi:hypothetical protein
MTNTDTHTNPSQATGPKTTEGKRIAARNATSHGLFARDVVLPHLGEDPAGYKALLDALTNQLQPHNLLEQHYVEKIAAASWRLRRLQRWQAQLFEDPEITEDQALDKLDRVMRHETNLHRQIDTSVKMLARELPKLFQDRVRAELIRDMNGTEQECREDPYMGEWITSETRRRVSHEAVPASVDPAMLDTAPSTAQNCQNEPLAPEASQPPPALGAGGSRSRGLPLPCLPLAGGGGAACRDGGGFLRTGGSSRVLAGVEEIVLPNGETIRYTSAWDRQKAGLPPITPLSCTTILPGKPMRSAKTKPILRVG